MIRKILIGCVLALACVGCCGMASREATYHDGVKQYALESQARGEARLLQINISTEAKDTIGRLLEMAGSLFIKVVPSIIAAL